MDVYKITHALLFQTEREDLVTGSYILTIDRGCASYCPYGCRYIGYGQTYRICTSCCDKPGCNTGYGSAYFLHHQSTLTYMSPMILSIYIYLICILR